CLLFLPQELNRGNTKALLGLFFPIAGIFLLWLAIRNTWEWEKFGASLFIPDTMPGVIGGPLKGLIRTHRKFGADSRFQLKLVCTRRTTSGSGDNRSTWENILWQEEQQDIPQQPSMDYYSSVIPVAFTIPSDAVATTLDAPGDAVIWTLQIACATGGLGY